LKQIGLGVMMYVQDYDERYPVYNYKSDEAPSIPSAFWGGNATNGYNWYWTAQIYSYIKNDQVFFCPSSSFRSNIINMNYGVNSTLIRSTTATSLSLSGVEAPSSTYMVMDAGTYNMFYTKVRSPSGFGYIPGTAAFATSGSSTDDRFGAPEDWKNGRHFDGINVTFADGHAKWLKSSEVANQALRWEDSKTSAWNPANTP